MDLSISPRAYRAFTPANGESDPRLWPAPGVKEAKPWTPRAEAGEGSDRPVHDAGKPHAKAKPKFKPNEF